jgi:hypothetical protein
MQRSLSGCRGQVPTKLETMDHGSLGLLISQPPAVRRQVKHNGRQEACTPARRPVNGTAKMEFPGSEVTPITFASTSDGLMPGGLETGPSSAAGLVRGGALVRRRT